MIEYWNSLTMTALDLTVLEQREKSPLPKNGVPPVALATCSVLLLVGAQILWSGMTE
jgi:hypothetical protein